MTRILIHIGYHKTGTTWLRHRFFSREDMNFHVFSRYDRDIWRLMRVHPLSFDAEACRQRYAPAIEECRIEGKVPVITHERLSGDPHSGGYDNKELADRLRQVFPDARILIGIREQRSMILSCYKQYVKYGGGCSLKDYVECKNDPRRPQFRLANFKYHKLIGYYQELFGQENVLVQPYEKFRSDPRAYVTAIATYCGANFADGMPFGEYINTAMKPGAIEVERRLNPLIRRDSVNGYSPYFIKPLAPLLRPPLKFLNRHVPPALNARKERAWKTYIENVTADYYSESNRLTSSLIGVDLCAYEYQTKSQFSDLQEGKADG